MEILRKKRSHFRYQWNYVKKYNWWELKKIKNKTDKTEDVFTICDIDKKPWDIYLKNQGWKKDI